MTTYVTSTGLKSTINDLTTKISNTFAKKKESITKIKLVKSIPTDKIDTSTELVNCLRLYYVDHNLKIDETTGLPIEHYIDISVEDLGGSFDFKIWASGNDYLVNDYVVYEYSLYQANEDITGDTTFDENKYSLIIGGNSDEIAEWEASKSYVIGDKVKYNNIIYECIVAHTSSVFDDDVNNWIVLLEHYYNVSSEQYELMVTNGLIDNSNKYLFVINDAEESTETNSYEEEITESNQWLIQHGLNTEYYKLDITCLDSDGNYIFGDVNTTLSTMNLLVIDFCTEVGGKVYLKK